MSDKYPGGFVTAGAPAGYSVYTNGSGSGPYIRFGSSAALTFGTGDFTVEFWVYFLAVNDSTISYLYDMRDANGTGSFFVEEPGNTWTYRDGAGNLVTTGMTSSTFTANQWYHVAVCRASGVINFYINGTKVSSNPADTSNYATSYISIMSRHVDDGGSNNTNAYTSNFRIVKGTAVYTANFTPPTQLFAITGTSLLTCTAPTIIDQSSNNLTPTTATTNVPTVSNFTPFAGYRGFNPALGAAAGGVWTLDEAAYYQNNRQWPIYDPYFNQTTLMLHGNGTNGAQNNTFLDSSTNNFTITRNGNTTQGTFTPFSQTGWSNYFNGSTDYLSNTSLTNFLFTSNLSTMFATFEAWVYPTSWNGNSGYTHNPLWGNNGTEATFGFYNGTLQFTRGVAQTITATGSISLNTWSHVAVTINQSTVTFYINGVNAGTGTLTGALGSRGTDYIGYQAGGGGFSYFAGYISNFRISTNVVYTSNFTPSTVPLIATTGTKTLTCQSNRFADNSANNFALTVNGTPSVQAFSPFVPAYITPTTYSNYFDGSTGYLSFTSSSGIAFGTGDYTVEAWVNLTSSSTYQTLFGSATSDALMFNIYSMNSVVIQTSGTNIFATFSGATFATNTWYHVAVSRSSGTVKAFVNGVQYGSTITSNTTNYAQPTTNTIGSNAASQYFGGCLSNLRLVKGTALYTAAFTPPTAPLTAISGTSLLTCQSSTFIDNSTNNFAITATGSVQPVTSPTPFPAKVDTTTLNSAYSTSLIGGSYYGAATGDYLSFTDPSNLLDMGTTAASFECWYYMTATGAYQNIFLKYGGTAGWNATNGIEYGFAINNGVPTLSYFTGGTSLATLTDPTTRTVNQWYHFAIATDASNNISMYVNGVRVANATSAISKPTTRTTVNIGSTASQYVVGYLAGMRFLTGANAYNAASLNIGVPPLTPPTAVSGTQLLCNFTNGGIFDNTAKNVLETVGNAQISTTQSKWGGSSIYFANGGTDYLLNPYVNNPNFSFGGDFTVELWVYPTSTPDTYNCIIGNFSESGTTYGWNLMLTSGGLVHVNVAGTSNNSAQTVPLNTWTHLAITRAGSTVYIFVNGKRDTTTLTTSALAYNPVYPLRIGRQVDTTPRYFYGYMDDIRITKGVARYVTNFTPPTSQLQDQ